MSISQYSWKETNKSICFWTTATIKKVISQNVYKSALLILNQYVNIIDKDSIGQWVHIIGEKSISQYADELIPFKSSQ